MPSVLPLLVHVFLYGGITAYNSYYDRDEGPVGGPEFVNARETAVTFNL